MILEIGGCPFSFRDCLLLFKDVLLAGVFWAIFQESSTWCSRRSTELLLLFADAVAFAASKLLLLLM